MERLKIIQINIPELLYDHLENAAQTDGVSLNNWVCDALKNQQSLWDAERAREAIALEEIQKTALHKGQSIAISVEGELTAASSDQCEMCFQEIKREPEQVEGPFFCPSCMEIAKGGDFSEISP